MSSRFPALFVFLVVLAGLHCQHKGDNGKSRQAKEAGKQNRKPAALNPVEKRIIRLDSIYRKRNAFFDTVVTYKGCRYFTAFVNLDSVHFRVMANTHDTNRVIKDFRRRKLGDKVLLFCNAGMYLPDLQAQGLLVSERAILKNVDTAHEGYGNFYMQPNGVFLVGKRKAQIVPPKAIVRAKRLEGVLQATQSGPVMVRKGQINPKFTPQSTNMNVRNGVGILSGSPNVIILSQSLGQVRFYEFANFLKTVCHASDALYLDGVVSQFYSRTYRYNFSGAPVGPAILIEKK